MSWLLSLVVAASVQRQIPKLLFPDQPRNVRSLDAHATCVGVYDDSLLYPCRMGAQIGDGFLPDFMPIRTSSAPPLRWAVTS